MMRDVKAVTLVKDHKPDAVIVIAEDAPLSVQLAAAELNHHLKQVTGTELPVRKDNENITGNRILVGESCATRKLGFRCKDFKEQEYIVKVIDNQLLLMGFDDQRKGSLDYQEKGVWDEFDFWTPVGSLYAVYDFLERVCGIRWYLPTKLGSVIPEKSTISVSSLDIRRHPWAETRLLTPHGLTFPTKMPKKLYCWNVIPWQFPKEQITDFVAKVEPLSTREGTLYWLRQRLGGKPFIANHAFTTWRERFLKSHPEYFAVDKNGKILIPPNELDNKQHLRYTSPAVLNQIVKDILAWRSGSRKDKNGIWRFNKEAVLGNCFSINPQDGSSWSMDPETQRLILPHATKEVTASATNKESEYVYTYAKMVADKLAPLAPDATLSILAYAGYFFPPKNITLPPNLAVTICKQQVKSRTSRDDAMWYDIIKQWGEKTSGLHIWEYFNFPQHKRMNVFPGLVPARICHEMEKMRQFGVKGYFMEYDTQCCFRPTCAEWFINPAVQHVNYYFALKLLDTTERPGTEVLEEYYRLFYGPARKPMKEFFTLMENSYHNESTCPSDWRGCDLNQEWSWTKICPPEKLKKFAMLIDEAKKLSASQYPYNKRVELIEKAILDWMKHSSKMYFENIAPKKMLCHIAPDGFDWTSNPRDKSWNSIPATSDFSQIHGHKAARKTVARTAWDEKFFYVLFTCHEPEPNRIKSRKRAPGDWSIRQDDCVELHIDYNSDKKLDYMWVVNASGSVLPYGPAAHHNGNRDWSSNIRTVTHRYPDYWTVAMKIPWSDMGWRPKEGDKIRINFCRTLFTGQKTAWCPTQVGKSCHGYTYDNRNYMGTIQLIH